MNEIEQRMLGLIAEATMAGGYIASWHISEAIPGTDDLNVVCSYDTPGNAAMRRLIRAGLVEEVPDLGCRYRLCGVGRIPGARMVQWLNETDLIAPHAATGEGEQG